MIRIRHARPDERKKTYEWLCHSDTTQFHMGPPNFPEHPVPSWEEFCDDFEPFYFEESEMKQGSVMIIMQDDEEVGCICYACFHLNPKMAELDIWLKSQSYCHKGIGTKAIKLLCAYLNAKISIESFIIRPSEKNIHAIRAYEKSGFVKVKDEDKQMTVQSFLLKEYLDVYGNGDYGLEETAVLTKA